MENPYTLVGGLTLDAGSWADWFSGIMSFAAVATALAGYWWSERLRKADFKDRQRQAGKQIAVKLFRVLNGTDDIRRHLTAEYTGPRLEGVDAHQQWRRIHPLVGLSFDPGLQLDGTEQTLLIDAKAHNFMMELMLVISRYQSVVLTMKEYAVRYESIQQLMPAPVEWEGGRAIHQLSPEELMRMRPYSSALEGLIEAVIDMAGENIEKCAKLADEYNPVMCSYFGDDKFPKLVVPKSDDSSEETSTS
jgi:hypothetical protein